MLSKLSDHLPAGKDYIYEIKMDGQRTLAEVSRKEVRLYTRNFQIVTNKYPELDILSNCLVKKSALLDGEIVALRNGIPSFELLQQRMSLRSVRLLSRVTQEVPVLYYVFDILEMDGRSMLEQPLLQRKKALDRSLRPVDPVKILPFFRERDLPLLKAKEYGYEGIVAKNARSAYYPGKRTDLWIKFKFQQVDSFVIGGWMEGGRSQNFGSIVVGKFKGRKLVHCGRVGTGFNEATIRSLMKEFAKIEVGTSPFEKVAEDRAHFHWLRPRMVAEVKFKEWTSQGIFRAPVFLGLRPDIRASDCKL